jgi:archaellum component FlaC
MDFLSTLFKENPSSTLSNIVIIFFILMLVSVSVAFYYDLKKNKLNEKKLSILERAIKDLIEEFRSFELLFSEQKKILHEYKYTLERLEQETSRLADTSKEDSNITNAIKMASEGKTIEQISETTGMSREEIEPIIKFHGK